jgi:hypothetical protein
MITVEKILFSENGMRISYSYTIDSRLKKYFNMNNLFYVKYEIDVSSTPLSIAIIPFLANIVPMSWFVGFDIYIDEIDEVFLNSLKNLKEAFSILYPKQKLKGNIKVKKIVRNTHRGENIGLLFGGGVDAYTSYIRHKDEKLKLITIHGADIDLCDRDRWKAVVNLNQSENMLDNNSKLFVEANLRGFYTYHLDLIGNMSWWVYVQHAVALLGSIAPLTIKYEINKLIIASSYTENADMSWGSTPYTDEQVKWANVSVMHDGYELKRQDKIDLIVKEVVQSNHPITLRVCYSELRNGFNCSKCEKCYRTILGIILAGDDPNKYGFSVDENIYKQIIQKFKNGGASKGVRYFWTELTEKANASQNFYVFKDRENEKKYIKQIADGLLMRLQRKGLAKAKISSRIKFIIRNRYPILYVIYRKFQINRIIHFDLWLANFYFVIKDC